MKKLSLCLAAALGLLCASSVRADDAEALAGKWSTKKTNDQGDSFTQTIEVKKGGKFVFEILGADSQPVIHAEGDLKFEKLGPFSSARFSHIKGGQSADSMDDVDDEYVVIYRLEGDTWTMAANFDKERERQKPTADVYHRAKAAASKPAGAK